MTPTTTNHNIYDLAIVNTKLLSILDDLTTLQSNTTTTSNQQMQAELEVLKMLVNIGCFLITYMANIDPDLSPQLRQATWIMLCEGIVSLGRDIQEFGDNYLVS